MLINRLSKLCLGGFIARYAIIGLGKIGTAIAKSLIKSGVDPTSISGSVRRVESISRVGHELPGVFVTTNNAEVVKGADIVILAVKPYQVLDALMPIRDLLSSDQLLISVVAGVTTGIIEGFVLSKVIRAMPNIGIVIERGVTAVAPGSRVSEDDVKRACGIFSSMGRCVVVNERYMDAITAISGSGPAFMALILEALWEAGLLLGIPTDISWELAVGTLETSAELLRFRKPWEVVEEVTTPGGVTIRGIKVAEEGSLRGLIMRMIEETARRGGEISREIEAGIRSRINN
ncbi:pyrroline-5-carboxylate reductase [Vulcanisaeta souniana JCM 11219]|uniref:Pyrroline-5-carboxylate reductase n=1 Tax=Vulcanisaeta souniana JCM 11219 TaxID=1293586 RepID=A0A830E044_9CREN|nr:pyrroline-5-carboxylate reductase [Vulcanisaeta souniana JCM 11219]GGI69469.1 pyrroline-5-carboxylate reductase [Vulcanisaeta souniana JCM 11219]